MKNKGQDKHLRIFYSQNIRQLYNSISTNIGILYYGRLYINSWLSNTFLKLEMYFGSTVHAVFLWEFAFQIARDFDKKKGGSAKLTKNIVCLETVEHFICTVILLKSA